MNENNEIKCLDHGYVRLIDFMGTDKDIVRCAKISYNKDDDLSNVETLLKKMIVNHHTSPFEMVEFKFEIKCPIFVARQIQRHRTANINELSRRYTELDDDFYIPSNLNEDDYSLYTKVYELAEKNYKELLQRGIPKEKARIVLPLSVYTRFYWKIDLHNLLHFLKLRLGEHTQIETRVFAKAISLFVEKECPLTWKAFASYNESFLSKN